MTAPSDHLVIEPPQTSKCTDLIVSPARSCERRVLVGASYLGALMGSLVVALGVLMATLLVFISTGELRDVQRRQSETAKIALSLSINQLHSVAMRNVPYSAEFRLVRMIAEGDAAIARDLAAIEPLQHGGLPSPKRIVSDFEQAAAVALIAERTGPRPGWFDEIFGRVSAVTVALGMELNWNPLGSAAAPAIKAAADALRDGDLAGAVRRVDALPVSARTLFEPWIDLVQSRIDAVAAIDRLVLRAANGRIAGRPPERSEGERR
jgi:hypothetical protein